MAKGCGHLRAKQRSLSLEVVLEAAFAQVREDAVVAEHGLRDAGDLDVCQDGANEIELRPAAAVDPTLDAQRQRILHGSGSRNHSAHAGADDLQHDGAHLAQRTAVPVCWYIRGRGALTGSGGGLRMLFSASVPPSPDAAACASVGATCSAGASPSSPLGGILACPHRAAQGWADPYQPGNRRETGCKRESVRRRVCQPAGNRVRFRWPVDRVG